MKREVRRAGGRAGGRGIALQPRRFRGRAQIYSSGFGFLAAGASPPARRVRRAGEEGASKVQARVGVPNLPQKIAALGARSPAAKPNVKLDHLARAYVEGKAPHAICHVW